MSPTTERPIRALRPRASIGIKLVDDFYGTLLRVTQPCTRMITPMLFVLIALASTDLLSA
jgi:hypothetical protein